MNMANENEFYEDEWEDEDENEWPEYQDCEFDEDEDYENEDYENEDYENEDDEDNDLEEYEVGSRLISTNTVTVEFSYEQDTPLLFVLDEIINYVVDHDLDYATINSMQTELVTDFVDSLVLTVTFNA